MKNRPRSRFRHELKYLLSATAYSLLKMRLRALMRPDEHAGPEGHYTVRSLYFDDLYNSAYHEKYMGVSSRQKYRVRIYNYSDSVIHLERKLKVDRFIRKESVPLERWQAEELQCGDAGFLLEGQDDLHRIFYYDYLTRLLRPRVIVDYEREAYVMDAGDVRVTFDKNVRAGMEGFDLFNGGMSMNETVESGKLIMEVKYTQFLPEILRQLLSSSGASEFLAVSKYILCCDQTLYKRQFQ